MTTRTNLNLDREKVRLAAEILGTTGPTATVDAALSEIIASDARRRLVDRMRGLSSEQRDAILHSWA